MIAEIAMVENLGKMRDYALFSLRENGALSWFFPPWVGSSKKHLGLKAVSG